MLCEYGCEKEAKYQFKNGKWCCSENFMQCPVQRKKNSIQKKKAHRDPNSKYNLISCKEKMSNSMKEIWKDPDSIFNSKSYRKSLSDGVKESWTEPNSMLHSISCKEKKSNSIKEIWKDPNSKYNSISYISKLNKSHKLSIEKINKKYPFFSKIEEMRYSPDNSKEIQVYCKNHNCKNSKEKDGWFTPSGSQLAERIRQLENNDGNDGSYFYCSQHCKDNCGLYNVKRDPYKDNNKPYTSAEKEVFNKLVLKRDNEICYYCGEHATIVHHLRPQKLEPFFALDPDYAISCCEKHHYKYGHPTGSEHSTGNLAKIVCSVESQKFLEQNHK